MRTTVTSPIDQGLGVLSSILLVAIVIAVIVGIVIALRSREARGVVVRVSNRLSTSSVGRLLNLTAPGEAARFSAGVSSAVQGDVKSTIVLSLQHNIQPCGWVAVAVPPTVQAWAAANADLARGVTRAAVGEAGVDAVVAVNARFVAHTGAQHHNRIREQARKKESVMEVLGVTLLASEVDAFTVSVGHTKAAAMANAQRLSGSSAGLVELTEPIMDSSEPSRSRSRPAPDASAPPSAPPSAPLPTRSAVSTPLRTRSAFEGGGREAASAIAVATMIDGSGTYSREITTAEPLSIGRLREAGLEVTGDLSVSAHHLLARLLPGGQCVEVHALGRTGSWATDAHDVTKYMKKGDSAVLRMPAKVVLGDARTTVVNFETL